VDSDPKQLGTILAIIRAQAKIILKTEWEKVKEFK
jgi:hypothetical protein